MRLENEKIKANVGLKENDSNNYGLVECRTVNGEELISTLESQINNVTKNEAGIYQVELKNQVEWLTGHNPKTWISERLIADQNILNRLMAEAFAVAVINRYYENKESGVPENVAAAEHEVVGEIAWRLSKNPWHDAKKDLNMVLHTDVNKALNWVGENAGDKKHYGWVPVTLGGLGMVSVACNPVIDTRTPMVETANIPSETAADTPFVQNTPESTEIPTYHVEAAGGAYTAKQEAINVSQLAIDQQSRIQRWLDYWVNFDNRPFALNTDQIHWKYIYDNIDNPSEVMMMIEAGGEYGGKLFTVPLGVDNFADFPPPVVGDVIEVNYGPLELTSGTGGLWLSVDGGIPVRRNGSNQIVERLDMKTGQWVKAENPYEIDKEKLFNFPKSYEDVVANPEKYQQSPDFFGDTEAAMNWWNNVCIPMLGEQSSLEANFYGSTLGAAPDGTVFGYTTMDDGRAIPLISNPQFFYFDHEGVIYPVLIISLRGNSENNKGTWTIILHNKTESGNWISESDGFDAIKYLAEGKKIGRVFGERISNGTMRGGIKKFADSDYNWTSFDGYHRPTNVSEFPIGIGFIQTIH